MYRLKYSKAIYKLTGLDGLDGPLDESLLLALLCGANNNFCHWTNFRVKTRIFFSKSSLLSTNQNQAIQQRCIQRFPTQSIQEFLEISRKFSRNFTPQSRSRGIFNSLFTLDLDFGTFSFHFSLSISISRHFHFTFHSRNEWTRFSFHFSLLEISEPEFHFTFHFSNF